MTKLDNAKLADAFREIDKRDDLILLHKKAFDNEVEINKMLRKQLIKERRRNRLNKFLYLVAGAGGTYLILK